MSERSETKSGQEDGDTTDAPMAASSDGTADQNSEPPMSTVEETEKPIAEEGSGTEDPPSRWPTVFLSVILSVLIMGIAGSAFLGQNQYAHDDSADLKAAISMLEQDVDTLRGATIEAADLSAKLAALEEDYASRIDELTHGQADLLTDIEQRHVARLDAIEDSLAILPNAGSLGISDLQGRLSDIANRIAAVERLLSNLASLEQRIAAIESTLAAKPENEAEQAASLMALSHLRASVSGSEPYRGALDMFRATGGAAGSAMASVEILDRHADTGLQTVAALRQAFTNVVDAALTPRVPTDGDWLESATAEVKKLVRFRRTGPDVAGETPEAIIARAEVAVANGDLAGAVDQMSGLPETVPEVSGWIELVKARLAADDAIDALTSTTLAHVSSEAPSE